MIGRNNMFRNRRKVSRIFHNIDVTNDRAECRVLFQEYIRSPHLESDHQDLLIDVDYEKNQNNAI